MVLNSFSQGNTPHQLAEQNNAAMELINGVTGVDEEGRSRQRILTFAAKRYFHLTPSTSVSNLAANGEILTFVFPSI